MYKKWLAVLLALAVVSSVAACGEKPQYQPEKPSDSGSVQATTEGTKPADLEENTVIESAEEITPDTWGATESWSATNGTIELFYVNFPEFRGFGAGGGLASEQSDGSVAIIGGQNELCGSVDALSEVFPAFFSDVEFTLDGFYGIFTDNYNCTVESDKAVTINGQQMHSFTGMISFDDPDEVHFDCPYVAYAVQLEDNGAYAYWLVLDDSEEPNQDLIAEHAYNMALTYREEK